MRRTLSRRAPLRLRLTLSSTRPARRFRNSSPGWTRSCTARLDSQLCSCTAPAGLAVVQPRLDSQLYSPGWTRSCTAPAGLALVQPRLDSHLCGPGWTRTCAAPAGLAVVQPQLGSHSRPGWTRNCRLDSQLYGPGWTRACRTRTRLTVAELLRPHEYCSPLLAVVRLPVIVRFGSTLCCTVPVVHPEAPTNPFVPLWFADSGAHRCSRNPLGWW